jgi:hypothetical protein
MNPPPLPKQERKVSSRLRVYTTRLVITLVVGGLGIVIWFVVYGLNNASANRNELKPAQGPAG